MGFFDKITDEIKTTEAIMSGKSINPTPNTLRFIYCLTDNDSVAETLLTSKGLRWTKNQSLQYGIDEYQFSTDEETFNNLTNTITGTGLLLQITNSRLSINYVIDAKRGYLIGDNILKEVVLTGSALIINTFNFYGSIKLSNKLYLSNTTIRLKINTYRSVGAGNPYVRISVRSWDGTTETELYNSSADFSNGGTNTWTDRSVDIGGWNTLNEIRIYAEMISSNGFGTCYVADLRLCGDLATNPEPYFI